MGIYEKLANMSSEQVKDIWDALAHQVVNWSEPYSGLEPNGPTMGDWVMAVYSEMDRRNLPKTGE